MGADDPIEKVEKALLEAGMACRNLVLRELPNLTSAEVRSLVKCMSGCFDQRFNIRSRVAKRGAGELNLVRKYMAKACETLLEILERLSKENEE